MRLLYKYRTKGLWWFRICGYGLAWKNIKLFPLLFSERNGYVTGVLIGNWYIQLIKRNDL